MPVRRYCRLANTNSEVEFRDAIATAIPTPIKLLEEEEEDIRSDIVRLINRLAKHSEWSLNSLSAQLMRITKSSRVTPQWIPGILYVDFSIPAWSPRSLVTPFDDTTRHIHQPFIAHQTAPLTFILL